MEKLIYSAGTVRCRPVTLRFGPFILNSDSRQLTRQDGDEIHLSPKAFDLLVALAAERPNVLSKSVLQQRLWPNTFVAEANLSNLVAEIREALGDQARQPLFIRTAHRVGYAFCGQAAASTSAREEPAPRPACWIEWGTRRFPLPPGEHVIGRDPDAAVRIDASTVSRRHARVVVTAEDAVLEDFGSKNGTFVGAARVTSPVRLADGDTIRIGSLLLSFRVRAPFGSTETQTEAFS
jgi:DNA-binding winged helix-turn-helix (wHTH) protein